MSVVGIKPQVRGDLRVAIDCINFTIICKCTDVMHAYKKVRMHVH